MSADDDTVTVYPDHAGGWRWQKQAANGRVIASSGEAFDSEHNAVRAAERANPGYDITIGEAASETPTPTEALEQADAEPSAAADGDPAPPG